MYPKAIRDLIESFSRFPGVGKKSAQRMALYVVEKLEDDEILAFSNSLINVKDNIKECPICGHITDVIPCSICQDDSRDNDTIIVVEESKDVFALEKIGAFKGKYHVLGGCLSPINGVNVDDLRVYSLLDRIKSGNIREMVVATNATIEGETTALFIKRLVEDEDILITRIAHGLPVGGDLEYADSLTLLRALEGRRKL